MQQRFGKAAKNSERDATRSHLAQGWLKVKQLVQDYDALAGLQNLSATVATIADKAGEQIQHPPDGTRRRHREQLLETSVESWLNLHSTQEETDDHAHVIDVLAATRLLKNQGPDVAAYDPATGSAFLMQAKHHPQSARHRAIARRLLGLATLHDADPQTVLDAAAQCAAQMTYTAAATTAEADASQPALTVEERLTRLEHLVDGLREDGRATAPAG
ncbi:hypothetical protein GCM10012285_41900 [Streptomyces kronopolitis]|uniref:Uncharacterized protein n=1 Tax=Streptomyces kronopolitis TaxID=1612435 RepID=A0ABQ2JQ40_9ACTN|nr:hypothetical protein GCM10012285_41900 [Streptomyces kronopolitis]